jgi:N6-adenosine-specific RNA methylase IME4
MIMAMPVSSLAEENAHLYLWTTNNHLPDALRVMSAWGFKYKTMITWAKDRMGIGQYFRGMTEHVLFGVRGNIPYRFKSDGKRAQGRTLITAPRQEHSAKPEELRSMIQVVSPGPYVELFARERYPGWDCWGNEVQSDIVMPGLWSAQEIQTEVSSEEDDQSSRSQATGKRSDPDCDGSRSPNEQQVEHDLVVALPVDG